MRHGALLTLSLFLDLDSCCSKSPLSLLVYSDLTCKPSGGVPHLLGRLQFFKLCVAEHLPATLSKFNCCRRQITHMPPELINEGKMSKAVDVYGFGVLLWEVPYLRPRPAPALYCTVNLTTQQLS